MLLVTTLEVDLSSLVSKAEAQPRRSFRQLAFLDALPTLGLALGWIGYYGIITCDVQSCFSFPKLLARAETTQLPVAQVPRFLLRISNETPDPDMHLRARLPDVWEKHAR